MKKPTFTIRSAQNEDAAGIAQVQIISHQETYSHVVPLELMKGDVWLSKRIDRWKFHIQEQAFLIIVACDNDKVVGWVTAGYSNEATDPSCWELKGLYVLSEYHGSGVGQQLYDAATSGHDKVFLWKVDDNVRAESFYTRNGFKRDGETMMSELYHTPIKLARMIRS